MRGLSTFLTNANYLTAPMLMQRNLFWIKRDPTRCKWVTEWQMQLVRYSQCQRLTNSSAEARRERPSSMAKSLLYLPLTHMPEDTIKPQVTCISTDI